MRTAILGLAILSTNVCVASGDEERYGSEYARALALCVEYKLPNSMARPPGFNLSKHLSDVQVDRSKLASEFASPSGISFVEQRIAQGGEELTVVCARELLSAAKAVNR
jgi:hypothetical protein